MSALTEHYSEFAEIVARACSGGVPGREVAQRYAICRQTLLQEVERDKLPGFIVQCISIYRFVELVTLFHHDAAARRAFVSEQLSTFRAATAPARSVDIFNAPL
jgi:hypothetical protein